ncbi:hypothetical protein GGR28_002332 [Lewinella aquimaris]|uniref:eCIS core domain-containing protein n=1 Tax=Neolewinella aquimaris TaxID=1835722 RepID=A0A840E8Q8_9BACT|nr:DUF4157 domain-containing protein [Neolewinella aquimaris]MBB4079707.1 hypothetical protein [Neolewinella aquimaris]
MKVAADHSTHSATRAQRTSDSAPFFAPKQAKEEGDVAGKEAFFQPKLTVGAPNDKYEREADRVADRVVERTARESTTPGPVTDTTTVQAKAAPAVSAIPISRIQRSPEPELQEKPEPEMEELPLQRKPIFESDGDGQVQRKCTACGEEEEEKVQRKCTACEEKERVQRSGDGGFTAPDDFSAKLNSSKGGGSPLPNATRKSMESAIGADFSGVRVHTGSHAARLSNQIGAQAFTHGNDVYFNSGTYNPGSVGGQRLLAHELTHTVQQGASERRVGRPNVQRRTGGVVQRAWYDFASDAAGWVGDKVSSGASAAWKGAKWAGGKAYSGAVWVKDKAVDGVMWIYNKAKSLITSGKKWVKEKWTSLKSFASKGIGFFKKIFSSILSFAKSPLAMIGNAIMNMDEKVIRAYWNGLTGKVQFIWNLFQIMGNGLIDQVSSLWNAIGSFVGGIFSKVRGITNHWAFKQLPSFFQDAIRSLLGTFQSLWDSIREVGNGLVKKVRTLVNDAFDSVRKFIGRVMGFAIDTIINGIVGFGKIFVFLKKFLSNPKPYLNQLMQRILPDLLQSAGHFPGQVAKFVGGGGLADKPTADKATASTETVQRSPTTGGKAKTKASWSEIGEGILHMMGQKWEAVKQNPGSILLNLLMDMVLPIVGNVKDVIKLFQDIKAIVTKPLSAGSLDEFWNSLLRLLDIPILIYNTFWAIIGRTLMLPLLVASFVPHPVVKGLAATIGYGLLGAMIQGELANIGHKLLLLRTGKTDDEEKKQTFNRLSDSIIAFAMEIAMAILMIVLSVVGNIVKGVFNFVRSKIVSPKVKPPRGIDPSSGKVNVDPDAPKSKPDVEGGKTKADVEEGKVDLETTKAKQGEELTPKELEVEVGSFKDGKVKKLDDPHYDLEVELPNGHKYKRKKNGRWCRFSDPYCFIDTDPFPTDREMFEHLKREGLESGTYEEFLKAKPGGVPEGTDLSADIRNGTVQKPKNGDWKQAPNWDNWVKDKGGKIIQHGDGSVTYVSKDGTWVRYNGQGYPDFSNHLTHPEVKSVDIDGFSKSRTPDYRKANEKAGKLAEWGDKPPEGYFWHHHENGRTMQLVPAGVHDKFYHAGGVSTSGI